MSGKNHKACRPGQWVEIVSWGVPYLATVVDVADGEPKRVRIQDDPMEKGRVLMPADYEVERYLTKDPRG